MARTEMQTKTPQQAAQLLHIQLLDLYSYAENHNLPFLSYLIHHAVIEAADRAKDPEPALDN